MSQGPNVWKMEFHSSNAYPGIPLRLCYLNLFRLPIAIAGRSATKLRGILDTHGAAAKSFQVLANVDINDQDSLKRMASSARRGS